MYSGNWADIDRGEGWQKIELMERRNRGVKSNFSPEVTEEEIQKEVEEPNPVWGDDAALPHDKDTLKVNFTLRVLGDLHIPSACNKAPFQDKLSQVINEYASDPSFKELSIRYANNIANGRFLWRNRVGAESIRIQAKGKGLPEPLVINAYDYQLRSFSGDENVSKLAKIIHDGLAGTSFSLLQIDAYVKLGAGQRIWPSQEMRMNIPKGEKSRHLFQLNGCAAIHSQKIGNALRTIDNWYDDDAEPIAVEPYGSVTHRGQAFRASRNDFKTLFKKWISGEALSPEEKHFVIAVLIRGGVFSEKE